MKHKTAPILLAFIAILAIGLQPVIAQALDLAIYLPVVSSYAVTPTAKPVANTGKIIIVSVFANPTANDEAGEYVEIRNDDTHDIQVKGWTLSDDDNRRYTFPSFVMSAGRTCRVFTDESSTFWCGFNFDSSTDVWDNTGECAYLRDSTGKEISKKCY